MEQINESSKETLTDNEKYTILSQLFYWGPVDSYFLYKWDWAELYKKISEDKTYPFIDIEKSLLEKLKKRKDFKSELEKTEYITDVWCWDGQKAVSLLKWAYWRWTYIPEDVSYPMAEIAKNNINNQCPNIKFWNTQIINTKTHLTSNYTHNMYLFLWGTICNMTDYEIVEELEWMDNNWTFDWNKILLSYFPAPETEEEIQELIKIYKSESNIKFHENWMDMLWLSKDDFEFDIIYEKDNPNQKKWPFPWKIKWIIRAKTDCEVNISSQYTKEIKKWQEFILHYSRRFSKEWIEELFERAKCKVELSIAGKWNTIKDGKWDTLVLLRKEPLHLKSVKTKIEKLLLWILALSSLATSWYVNDKHEKNEKLNQAQQQWDLEHEWDNKLTYYPLQTEALTIALRLDDIKPDNKKAIENMFNIWLSYQDTTWLSNNEIIQKFWGEYWKMLITNYWVTHSPYDLLKRYINLSNKWNELNQSGNFILYDNRRIDWNGNSCVYLKSNIKSVDNLICLWYHNLDSEWLLCTRIPVWKYEIFQHESNWQLYYILKTEIYKWMWIYLASEWKKLWQQVSFSSQSFDNINNKDEHDHQIVKNTEAFCKICDCNTNNCFILKNLRWEFYVSSGESRSIGIQLQFKPNGILEIPEDFTDGGKYFLDWDVYYIRFEIWENWEIVWSASESKKRPYSTAKFNEVFEDFSQTQKL